MKKVKWVPVSLAVLLTAILMVVAGCGATDSSVFTYAELSEPTAIDPALADEAVGVNITRYLFDGLVGYDSETGQVKPAVAESWDISDDATEFTFHLRKGTKFTNGRELTAHDFVYSWTRALDPATMSPMALTIMEPIRGAVALADGEATALEGVDAVDDYTLKVTLEFPLAEFVTFLGHPVCAPVPQEEVEMGATAFSENPVGNGPFKFKEWQPNDHVTLEINPDYYGERAKVDTVTMRIIPSAATALAELKAGNIDAIKSIPPGQAEALKDDTSVNLFEGQVNALGFVAFNLDMDPWRDNVSLRQALIWAVDRQTIAETVLQGQADPADGIVPGAMPGHQQFAMPYDYNPETAAELLAQAGYPQGDGLPPINLAYRMEGPNADVAQAIQANLAAVGAQVELTGLESGVFFEQMLGGELEFFIISWQADYNSVDTFLYPLFKSDQGQNVFGYANPEVDSLLERARSTLDENDRIRDYNDAERLILADAPLIPVFFRQDVMVFAPRVTGFVHTPLGDLALNEITVSES
ncbi:MAG: ABC transporter substrate-binding protein [Thermoleophilia bacterium]|nr:ABC transporter substrate-binding protein [Thermoleophilia bacterium]